MPSNISFRTCKIGVLKMKKGGSQEFFWGHLSYTCLLVCDWSIGASDKCDQVSQKISPNQHYCCKEASKSSFIDIKIKTSFLGFTSANFSVVKARPELCRMYLAWLPAVLHAAAGGTRCNCANKVDQLQQHQAGDGGKLGTKILGHGTPSVLIIDIVANM